MFTQTICADSPSATSSPASESGAWRCGAPAGPTTDLFGPVPALANLSARQARELGLMTSGTFGRTSTGSSRSAALQQSLESRLRVATQTLGSTLYRMTWKAWDTGSGRSRSRLRASVLRTSETGSTGWPTPGAGDAKQSSNTARWFEREQQKAAQGIHLHMHLWHRGTPDGLAHTAGPGLQGSQRAGERADAQQPAAERAGAAGGLAHAYGRHTSPEGEQRCGEQRQQPENGGRSDQRRGPGPTNGHWAAADWLLCRDARWRPVEPGTFPLAHGAPARVGRLRAYGNAICAPAAEIFIRAVMDTLGPPRPLFTKPPARLERGFFCP